MVVAENMTPGQKRMALFTMIVALVLEIVDMTIVNTALPAIKGELGADAAASQWIVAGYSLSFALLLMAGGRMGDSFGYRRVFLFGVLGFTAASAACGVSGSADQLVAARLLQGATGAIMAPQFMALMQVLFEPLERVSKLAVFGVIGGLSAIAGPIIGGLLIEADIMGLGWRVIFLINLPIGLFAFTLAWRYLPNTRSSRPAGFDVLGMGLFGLAVAALLWPLMRVEEGHWRAFEWACLAIVLPLILLGWRHVAARVRADRSALFDPMLFTIPSFRLGLAISIAFAAANAGFLLVFAFALQAERGQTPLVTGLLHMPFGFGAMFGIGFLGRKLLPRIGRWILVAGGTLMAVSSLAVLIGIGTLGLGWAALTPFLLLSGVGMGAISGCIPPVTVAQVDRDHAGAASGLLKTCQQLGGALGIALIGSTYFAGGKLYAAPPSQVAGFVVAAILLVTALMAACLPDDIFKRAERA